MSLPNPDLDFTDHEPVFASQLNDIVENVESLAAGTGVDDGAIDVSKLPSEFRWWELLGSVTAAVNTDTLSTAVAARKYLMIVAMCKNSGSINMQLRFNGDSGNNYSIRSSVNGAADTATGSLSSIAVDAGASASYPNFAIADVVNILAKEKLVQVRSVGQNTAGAANVPSRAQRMGKWANTAAQITTVSVVNTSTGDFAVGSRLLVFGHD